jgi:shikimate dehydrogenase
VPGARKRTVQTVTEPLRTRLGVLGSPIVHSKSPALHQAAFRTLGLPWTYDAYDITGETLPQFISSRSDDWRGLSLTMPLKRAIIPMLHSLDPVAELTGAVNTLLFSGTRRLGFNTDVYGITQGFERHGVTALREVIVLGGGATATSALVAASLLGAEHVVVYVRSPEKTGTLVDVASQLGLAVEVHGFSDVSTVTERADAVISSLPPQAIVPVTFTKELRSSATLFDVAYDPWPTPLAASWQAVQGRVVPGIDMLVNQALVQVRVFLTGDPVAELPDEAAVLRAMRGAIGLDR